MVADRDGAASPKAPTPPDCTPPATLGECALIGIMCGWMLGAILVLAWMIVAWIG